MQRLQRLREEAAAQPRAPIADHGEVLCTRGATGRGQQIARHHRGSAAREGSVAIRGVPPTRRRKSSFGTVSDRPGRHVEQRTPVQPSGVTRDARGVAASQSFHSANKVGQVIHFDLSNRSQAMTGVNHHRRSRDGVNT